MLVCTHLHACVCTCMFTGIRLCFGAKWWSVQKKPFFMSSVKFFLIFYLKKIATTDGVTASEMACMLHPESFYFMLPKFMSFQALQCRLQQKKCNLSILRASPTRACGKENFQRFLFFWQYLLVFLTIFACLPDDIQMLLWQFHQLIVVVELRLVIGLGWFVCVFSVIALLSTIPGMNASKMQETAKWKSRENWLRLHAEATIQFILL